ncbi:hypothetical protein TrLO_g7621 [Triparma laevis f. longispina]|uniref:Uncharacterized protein n=1 Tax=Triparma laevis f. longispina TaxID=1714387 RepID=A0A9W7ECT7_9STRA|nr:hypothetical protein TrLO_g7621 [Triparma laevis f. longispina]
MSLPSRCSSTSSSTHEFFDGIACSECEWLASSSAILATLILTFACGVYIDRIFASRQRVLRLKVISTFFQTAELIAALKVSWPFWTKWMPFSITIADSECVRVATVWFDGWDVKDLFYMHIYIPLGLFGFIIYRIYYAPRGSRRKKLSNTLFFWMVLWYAPVVRLAAQMFPCMDVTNTDGVGNTNTTRGDTIWVLVADPNVDCEGNKELDIARGHACMILLAVGIGFPYLVRWKLNKLRSRGRLRVNSTFVSVFHFYKDESAAFEAAQFVRKALLIGATVQYLPNPHLPNLGFDFFSLARVEALAVLIINVGFLTALLYYKPMRFCPSSYFPKFNLYLLVEVFFASATCFGSLLAFIGSFLSSDESTAEIIGILFVVFNFIFCFVFLVVYHKDLKKSSESSKAARLRKTRSNSLKSLEHARSNMAQSVKDTEAEWNAIVELIEEDPHVGSEVADELQYVRSQVHEAVRVEMKELDQILGEADSLSELFGDELKERIEFMNEKLQQKKPRKLLLGYRRLLKKVDKEYGRYEPTDDANPRPKIDQFKAQNVFSKADPVLEIAMNGGLKLCQGIFEKIEEMEDKLIPMFHRMDRDNNGALDVEEVEKAAKNFGMRMEFDDKTGKKIELRDKFQEMDEDGDGELTLDEFLEFGAFWFEELKRSETFASSFGGDDDDFDLEGGFQMSSFREAKNPTVGTARRASVILNNELKFETNNNGDLGRDKTMHHELDRLQSQTFKDAIGSTRLEVLKDIFESLAKMEKEIETTVKSVEKIKEDEKKQQGIEPDVEVAAMAVMEFQYVNNFTTAPQERTEKKFQPVENFAMKHGEVVKRRQSLVMDRKFVKQRGRTESVATNWRRQHLGVLLYLFYKKYDPPKIESISTTLNFTKQQGGEDFYREKELLAKILPKYNLTEADLDKISQTIEMKPKKVDKACRFLKLPLRPRMLTDDPELDISSSEEEVEAEAKVEDDEEHTDSDEERVLTWRDAQPEVLLYFLYERHDRSMLETIMHMLNYFKEDKAALHQHIVDKILPKYSLHQEDLDNFAQDIQQNPTKVQDVRRNLKLKATIEGEGNGRLSLLDMDKKMTRQFGRRASADSVVDWKRQDLSMILYFFFEKYDPLKLGSIETTLRQFQGNGAFLQKQFKEKILPRYKDQDGYELDESAMIDISREIATNFRKVRKARKHLNLSPALLQLIEETSEQDEGEGEGKGDLEEGDLEEGVTFSLNRKNNGDGETPKEKKKKERRKSKAAVLDPRLARFKAFKMESKARRRSTIGRGSEAVKRGSTFVTFPKEAGVSPSDRIRSKSSAKKKKGFVTETTVELGSDRRIGDNIEVEIVSNPMGANFLSAEQELNLAKKKEGGEWEEKFDENKKHIYYVHSESGRSSWTAPAGWDKKMKEKMERKVEEEVEVVKNEVEEVEKEEEKKGLVRANTKARNFLGVTKEEVTEKTEEESNSEPAVTGQKFDENYKAWYYVLEDGTSSWVHPDELKNQSASERRGSDISETRRRSVIELSAVFNNKDKRIEQLGSVIVEKEKEVKKEELVTEAGLAAAPKVVWEKLFDEKTKTNYWSNPETGKTSWINPKLIKVWERNLPGRIRQLGEDHKTVLKTYSDLGGGYHMMKEYEKSFDFYEKALKGYESTLGNTHPTTLETIKSIAAVYHTGVRSDEGYAKAAEYYERALRGFKVQLGQKHDHTKECAMDVALFYSEIKERENMMQIFNDYPHIAEKYYRQDLEECESFHEKEHEESKKCARNLAIHYEKTKEKTKLSDLIVTYPHLFVEFKGNKQSRKAPPKVAKDRVPKSARRPVAPELTKGYITSFSGQGNLKKEKILKKEQKLSKL